MTDTKTPPDSTAQRPPVTLTLGWREWAALPELGIPAIKAKMDTGARTSALHAFRVEPFERNHITYVRFWLHPLQRNRTVELNCEAQVIDQRIIRDSGGHAERRYVIESPISIGNRRWNIEITLTDREDMMFRMLLGRTAMTSGDILIDPAASYVTGRNLGRTYKYRDRRNQT